ncbi:MAG: isochorismatase family protein, partial [Alphaproteobacteria bacterium]
ALLVIDMREALLAADAERPSRVAAVEGLVARARAGGHPVIWITDSGAAGLAAGLRPAPDELQLEKTTADAFESTELEAELTILAVEQIVLCGLGAQGDIEATARGGAANGFEVIVADDARPASAGAGTPRGEDGAVPLLGEIERVRLVPPAEIFA